MGFSPPSGCGKGTRNFQPFRSKLGFVGCVAASQAGSSATVEHHPGIRCTPRSHQACTDPKADARLLSEAVAAARGATQVVLVINLQSLGPCDSPAAVAAADGEFNPCGLWMGCFFPHNCL